MEKIVFLDRDTVPAEFKAPNFPHNWQDYPTTLPEQLLERAQDATIIITNKIALREPVLAQLPQLKLIVLAATGYDCIDVQYCREHNIAVSNVRHYTRHSVPEHVMMLLLNLRRNFPAYQTAIKKNEWQHSSIFCLNQHPIQDLQGATLGIIGYGVLGQGVARLAAAFGMRVLIAEHKDVATLREGRTAFAEVLRDSDAISLHCPLTAATRGLIGAAEFGQMKPGAVLINCGRGGLVDESALVEAVRSGQIGGAGIDVLSTEPPREGNPLLNLDLPNLLVTPHNAWASAQAQENLADQIIDIIESFITGTSKNLVWT